VLRGSVHQGVECVDCHAGIKAVPHAETLPPPACDSCHADAAGALKKSAHGAAGLTCDSCHGGHGVKPAADIAPAVCSSCHGDQVQKYRAGVHGQAVARGETDAARCSHCHGSAHTVLPQTEPNSPTHHTHVAETCAKCHADRTLVERRAIPVPLAFQLYQKSVHGRAVAAGKAAATCNNCHASHDIRRATDPQAQIYWRNLPKTCGTCHGKESQVYLESIHGQAMQRGVRESPVCTDCHGEHSIPPTQDPESRVSAGAVTQTCASCHEATRITQKFGLPGARLATYQQSFHGLAARGGNLVAANCASCHGTHNIFPSKDARSTINGKNLPQTCGTCHPGASENFARGQVHVSLTTAQPPILLFIQRFYLLAILATIGGMVLHNGLDFLGKARRHYHGTSGWGAPVEHEGPAGLPRFFLRMQVNERVQHGLLALSFLILVYTGFALKYPESWPFAWLAGLERGYAWRANIHRVAAIVMILAGVWHVAYLGTARGRRFVADMLPKYQDVKDAILNMAYLFGVRTERPPFDRFSYIEKMEYWAVVWGTIVMAATGFALWFQTTSLRFVPLWVLDVATLIHFYEAILASLAILVWHLYFVIFSPDVYPMNFTWLTGRISEGHLAEEHPREYERLRVTGEGEDRPEASTESREPRA
jgi:formate dehydrogenase gamma subunit